jgi:hypothetical protein
VGKLADLLEARLDEHLNSTLRTKGTLGLTQEEAAMLPQPNDAQVSNLCEALSKKYKQAGWVMAAFRVKAVNDCSATRVQLDYSLTPPAKPVEPLKKAREKVEDNLALKEAQLNPCSGGYAGRARC